MSRCHDCHERECICRKSNLKPTDLFGSPFNCKKQIRTRRFTSPNSAFSPDELDQLQECIEKANHLLRSLANESDPTNTRQLQLHFLGLRGVRVKVKILCDIELPEDDEDEIELFGNLEDEIEGFLVNEEIELDEEMDVNDEEVNNKEESEDAEMKIIRKKGRVTTAGRDFIQINQVGSAVFVLYNRLLSVSRDCKKPSENEPEFLDANSQTRRELAFNFGEFVAKNLELVNLFFGIPLSLQLKEYIGKEVHVRTDDGYAKGTLVCAGNGEIDLLMKENNQERINIDDICYLEVLNLK